MIWDETLACSGTAEYLGFHLFCFAVRRIHSMNSGVVWFKNPSNPFDERVREKYQCFQNEEKGFLPGNNQNSGIRKCSTTEN
ncbi:MAG: hypothetical protein OEW39_00890 [Deltaproteobacteria bacterium]|nr:hypothetical protein [Deltaproteobacteria bacterium]